ncbi:MAG TPA: PAS domain S-box protein [Victivallales bacterium]|nr:PAS domain S-box protein [Victivallales bacterium]
MEFYKNKVKEWRKKRKLTIDGLAKYLGKSFRTVSAWERGERLPSETDVRVIANVLCVDITTISDLENINLKELPYYYDNLNSVDTQIYDNINIFSPSKIEGQLEIKRALESFKQEIKILKIQNIKFKRILDSLPAYIYTKNENLAFTYANPAFLSFLNKTNEEIIGRHNYDFYNNDESKYIREIEREILSGLPVISRKINIPLTSGKRKGILTGRPAYSSQTEGITGIIISIKDITDSVAIADRLNVLETAIENYNTGFWIQQYLPNKKWQFIYMNSAMEKISNVKLGLIYKDYKNWRKHVHEDDKQNVTKYFLNRETGLYEYRFIVMNKTRWFRSKFFTLDSDTYGKIRYGFIEDITDSKTALEIKEIFEDNINEIKDRMISVFDLTNHKYLFLNKAHENITGYSIKEWYKDPFFMKKKVAHPEDIGDLLKKYDGERKDVRKHTYRIITKKGKIIKLKSTLYPAKTYNSKSCFTTISKIAED